MQFSGPEEAPLVLETQAKLQTILLQAQAEGLSLPGAFKALSLIAAQVICQAYDDAAKRRFTVTQFPGWIESCFPFIDAAIKKHRARISTTQGTG